MGKHSNIILVDTESGNIVDAIKRVSIDTSRARQVLPGMRYEYPPAQDKIGFDELTFEEFAALKPSSWSLPSRTGRRYAEGEKRKIRNYRQRTG